VALAAPASEWDAHSSGGPADGGGADAKFRGDVRGVGAHELDVVDDDQGQVVVLGSGAAGFGADFGDGEVAVVVDEEGGAGGDG
jgi:hypothetical protein